MIVVLDNYDSFTYNLVQYLGQLAPIVVVRNDVVSVDEVMSWDPWGLVVSPGPGRPEDAGIAIPLIQAAGRTIPVLGVCLGHQAIAVAYGGQVVPAVRLMHGKADQIQHGATGLLKDLPNPFTAGRYHSLAVDVHNADELVVDAVSDDGTVMAVSHRRHPVYGVQFHPESVLTPQGMTLLGHFVDLTVSHRSLKGVQS
ncbi:MAG: anthranilate/aminodeoxychorismate synthase component II [Sulfobacillus acidophilus]|uniref:Anthranilate/aminodeoxychorismate synthase component II n=1 Tax=Sulfobacillus acidophilus TaxID=53633 RepID=A0A2T2WDT7_9FIRM|nr:MAG: anthranilate/aminodeoxychorismate synthase component II [Sulfobacillus acidophilus]